MNTTTEKTVLISAKGINKRFGVVQALNNVDFTVRKGEIIGLAGHNGAGKSVLLKILCGIMNPDSGTVTYLDANEPITDIQGTQDWGLYLVPQELSLSTKLSVADNIFIGRKEFTKNCLVNKRYIYSETKRLFKEFFNLEIDPMAEVGKLDSVTQRIVQVIRCLRDGAKAIIFDETTAGLTQNEREKLFGHFQTLKSNGLGIVFVSHMLDEMLSVCDTISVLRGGNNIGVFEVKDLTEDTLIEHIVGKKLGEYKYTKNPCSDEVLLSVKNVNTMNGNVRDVSFDVHKGEIIGIYGLHDQGQSLLLDSIFGEYRYVNKEISIEGKNVNIAKASDAVANGISFLPERGRKTNFTDKTITENMMAQVLAYKEKTFFTNRKREQELAQEQVGRFGIRGFSSLSDKMTSLSGGNIQKVLIARIMMNNPKVMMFIEPTQGIDIGAKTEVKRLLLEAAANGCGIVVVTAEINDIIEICNRAMIVRNGQVINILDATEENKLEIVRCSSGSIE